MRENLSETEIEPLFDGPEQARFPGIEEYGVIGDCRAAALISREGSIDWLCWPRFDKAAIFAALLDRRRGGHWRICTRAAPTVARAYVKGTNVLQTRFTTETGSALLTDLMSGVSRLLRQAKLSPDHEIIRRLECTAGEVEIEVSFFPRADYGAREVKIEEIGNLGLRMQVGRGVFWLRSSVPLEIRHGRAFARLVLRSGESLQFSFSYSEEAPAVLPPLDQSIAERIAGSIERWQAWSEQVEYDGIYREQVVRSALALKLLSFAPSGAIIAAPTTSLPERMGGDLNWDYRYCWLRDASLTVRALIELGCRFEAGDFLDWMIHATRLTQPELHILYSVYGDKAPAERTLDHLGGYQGSRPVRIGNAARSQFQLDVYGEVIDAVAQYAFHGGRLDRGMRAALIGFGNYVVKHWDLPDQGIWEPRTSPENHTHSRLLCWTALDRLVDLSNKGMLEGAPVDIFRHHAEALRQQIRERAWNPVIESYVSVLDGDQLDASLLLISWYGFEEADSLRMQGTYRAIRKYLGTEDGLLYRYPASEGTFAICSFWEAEFLALGGGTLKQASDIFERMMGYSNDLGLYGEEIDPRTGAALGNFPQAFTHVGLIGAALSLRQRELSEQQLAHRPDRAVDHTSTGGEAA